MKIQLTFEIDLDDRYPMKYQAVKNNGGYDVFVCRQAKTFLFKGLAEAYAKAWNEGRSTPTKEELANALNHSDSE